MIESLDLIILVLNSHRRAGIALLFKEPPVTNKSDLGVSVVSFPVQDFAREQSTSESDQQILLLVGFHQGKRLKFAGRVGTGFS